MEQKEKQASVSFNITWIDGGLNPINPNEFVKKERKKIDRIINAPVWIWWWELLWKILIGVVIWALMAVLLFVLFWMVWSLVWWWISDAQWLWLDNKEHQLAWVINLFLWFVVSFLWNMLLLLAYTFFFSNKYPQVWKTVWILLLTNIILSWGMAALFVAFKDKTWASTVLFVLFVCLSVFLSFCQIEFWVNPNYASSSMMWNVLGLCVTLTVLWSMLVPKLTSVADTWIQQLMLLTPVLSFPIMIFWQWVWDVIYAKLYELWSNPFYLPSPAELDTETLLEQQRMESKQEEVTVDL
jgi:hypothetical protein